MCGEVGRNIIRTEDDPATEPVVSELPVCNQPPQGDERDAQGPCRVPSAQCLERHARILRQLLLSGDSLRTRQLSFIVSRHDRPNRAQSVRQP
jgi:hypothetical protein